jgi:hypothetical protein
MVKNHSMKLRRRCMIVNISLKIGFSSVDVDTKRAEHGKNGLSI